MNIINAVGKRFGRLLLVRRIGPAPTKYECLCDCGNIKFILWSNLQSGQIKSCGCLRRELTQIRKRKPPEVVAVIQIRNYYKRNAKLRNIQWLISDAKVKELVFSPCHYCGIIGGTETNLQWTNRKIKTNGIDRIDNNKDYTDENSVACCKDCNFAKHKKSVPQFKSWLQRIIKHGVFFHG